MTAFATPAHAAVDPPTVTAPPTGIKGYPLWDSYYDLAAFGYAEQELFVSGTAHDAKGDSAPYTTRIIVSWPTGTGPVVFNGTVLLDWVNVTAQFENAVDTMLTRQMLMREGFAYVHVSAQAAGVCCLPGLTPQTWDPVRYAELHHPGDAYAFDMFTQVAQIFKTPGLDLMGAPGASSVKRILAAGQSQSANELADYIKTWLPTHSDAVGVIDGILVHGNVPGKKSFVAGSPIPVLHLLSDYEAQDDGFDPTADTVDPNYRLWEIAGASHSDFFIGYQSEFGHGPRVLGGAAKETRAQFDDLMTAAGNYGEVIHPLLATCTLAGATLPMHYADSAAIHQLNVWVATGNAPPSGPRFDFEGGKLKADPYGNTLGGIRMPPIDVPVAHYVSTVCQLGGITVPFTDAEIQALHHTHAEYYAAMQTRTNQAVADGWLLPEDAIDLMHRACAASVRFGEAQHDCAAYVPPPFNTPLAVPADAAASVDSVTGELARTGGDATLLAPFAVLVFAALVRLMTHPVQLGRRRLLRR